MTTPFRESPRIRRLRTDFRNLQQLRQDSSIFDYVAYGNPPERYEITFMGAGLRLSDDQARVEVQMVHRVEIRLGANYPRAMPELAWRTPIFHPNISAIGMVCLGGYGQFWVPSLQLDELCCMLWDMVRFENFDVASPYNRTAADWTRTQTQYMFPLDPRGLRDRLTRAPERPAAGAPAGGSVPVVAGFPTAGQMPWPGPPTARPAPPPRPGEEVVFLEETPPRRPPPDGDIVFID
jgi:ubiquitin-protein ligase